jgi:hypothetical protein
VDKAVALGGNKLEMAFAARVRGLAYYWLEDWNRCIDALNTSCQLREGTDGPPSGLDWFPLAVAHHHLRNDKEAENFYQQAVNWLETNNPEDRERQEKDIEAGFLFSEARKVFEEPTSPVGEQVAK